MNDQQTHWQTRTASSPAVGSIARPDDFFDDDPGADKSSLNLRAIIPALMRNRWLILAIIGAALLLGLLVSMLTTPKFLAETTIQIDQQAARVLESEDVEPNQAPVNEERFLQTQLDVLRSRSLAERVNATLRLDRSTAFVESMGEEPETALPSPALTRQVVGLLMQNLTPRLARDSRVATIGFAAPDPSLAARVANAFAEGFITINLERRYNASSYARNFLQTQLAQAKARLEGSERAAIAYARSAQLIDTAASSGNTGNTNGPSTRSLVTASLIDLNTSLSRLTTERVAAEERWRRAASTPLMSIAEVQSNPAISDLSRQRADLLAQLAEERQRRREDYPTVQQATARIAELDRQIATIAGNVRASIQSAYVVAQQQENTALAQLSRLKSATLTEQDRSVQYNILRREADTNRALYDGLLQRFREISAAAGITASNLSIVDTAVPPERPFKPRLLLNLLLAGVAGVACALGIVFLRETFDDTVRLPEDVENKLGTLFIGSVPVLAGGETPLAALAHPRSAFSEAYFSIMSRLSFSTANGLPRTLICTSSLPSEGKSTTSLALAEIIARTGRKVLLIDSDLRKPSLHRTLGFPNDRGFTNLLTHQATVEELVQQTATDNLSFMACGPLPPAPGELLASADLPALLETMNQKFDLVLIDAPPVMGFVDAPLLASAVQGTVFVMEAGRTHNGQGKVALRRLRSNQANLLGVVLTKFDARKAGQSSDYGYYYEYRYGHEAEAETPASGFKKL